MLSGVCVRRSKKVKKYCKYCNKEFQVKPSKINTAKYCSRECKNIAQIGKELSKEHKRKISIALEGRTGSKCVNYKGGRKRHSGGYILILKPEHPFCCKKHYVREHRLVMEKQLGRYLKPEERVHHINEIVDDNRIENFILFKKQGYHLNFHRWGYYNPKYIVFDGRNYDK